MKINNHFLSNTAPFCSRLSKIKLICRLLLLRKVTQTDSKYNKQVELVNQVVWRSDLDMSQTPNKKINLFMLYH